MIPTIAIRLGLAFVLTLIAGRLLIKEKALRRPPESVLSNSIFVYIISLKLSLLITNFSSVQNELLYLLYGWGSLVNQALAAVATLLYFVWYLKRKSVAQKQDSIFLSGSLATFVGVFMLSGVFIGDLSDEESVETSFLEERADLNGSAIEVNEGNIILNFWATWCPPCRAEMPDLNSFVQNNPTANFVSINNIASEKAGIDGVKDFMGSKGYNFRVIPDYNSQLTQLFNVNSFPTTIVINTNGEIIEKHVGVVNEAWLEGFLSK